MEFGPRACQNLSYHQPLPTWQSRNPNPRLDTQTSGAVCSEVCSCDTDVFVGSDTLERTSDYCRSMTDRGCLALTEELPPSGRTFE